MEQNNKPKSFAELVAGDKLYRIRIDWADIKKYRKLEYSVDEYTVTENLHHNDYDVDLCIPYITKDSEKNRVFIPREYMEHYGASVGEYIKHITDKELAEEFLLDDFNREIEKSSALMTEHLKIYEEEGDKIDLLQHLMIKIQRNK